MITCWKCGHRMELVTDGNGQLVKQCGNCGRISKPLPPKKPGQSDSPYRASASGPQARVSGASGDGDRGQVSGAVRVYVRKPGQRGSVRTAHLSPSLCGTRYEDPFPLGRTGDLTPPYSAVAPFGPALIGGARTHGYVPRKVVANT